MKTLFTSLLLFLSVALYAQDLSIATFNCEFLITKKVHVKYGIDFNFKGEPASVVDEWKKDSFRNAKFEEACDRVAGQIKLINADILGLTEIGDSSDVEILRKKLKDQGVDYKYAKVCNSADRTTGQHVALLSKYPIEVVTYRFDGRAYYFTEPDMDETGDTGISKGMHARVKVGDKTMDVFVLHLKSERGGFEDDAQRKAQAEIARREIYPLLNDPNNYVVVMGDLNSEKRHETLLTLRGFNDIHPELIQTGDDEFFEDYTLRTTYNFRGNREQIDHILLSHSFKALCKSNSFSSGRWGIRTSIIETQDPAISDHNALKVEMNYR